MRAIETYGSFYKKNGNGDLVNTTTIKSLPLDLLNSIDKIIIEYNRILPAIDSIYIRGSVAEGKYRNGISDIDTFALTENESSKVELKGLKNASIKLSSFYNSSIDLECVSKKQVMFDSDYYFMQIVIKVQSHIIWGNSSFQKSLPEFKPNSSLISLIFNLENRLKFALSKLETIKEHDTKYWCHWVMKTIIRASFELVIDKIEEYTRDLYLCYSEFSKFYPDKREICYKTLSLAINPTNDKNEIISIINELGFWIVSESRAIYPNRIAIIKTPISTKYLDI